MIKGHEKLDAIESTRYVQYKLRDNFKEFHDINSLKDINQSNTTPMLTTTPQTIPYHATWRREHRVEWSRI